MYKGVLVTLDGSPLSEAVLPVVADLVGGTGAVITLLTVGDLPQATVSVPKEIVRPYHFLMSAAAVRLTRTAPRYVETRAQAIDRQEAVLEAYLERKAATLRTRGLQVRTVVEFGNAAERIIEYARRPEIDVVAMATHGRTGLQTLIFGSVASRVLSSGVRPVILVRPRRGDHEWEERTRGEAAESDG